jgi:hypothetical protein
MALRCARSLHREHANTRSKRIRLQALMIVEACVRSYMSAQLPVSSSGRGRDGGSPSSASGVRRRGRAGLPRSVGGVSPV